MAVDYIKTSAQKKTQLWNNMYTRCYSKKYHKRSPKYTGCEICDEWLADKYKFFKWVDENYYSYGLEQIDLDKDILVKGNKIYGPETCVFVPHSINTYFENIPAQPKYSKSKKQWEIKIFLDGSNTLIGYYDTEEEAKMAYIKIKEASILEKANLYRDGIPIKLYNAMINWKIELSDWVNNKEASHEKARTETPETQNPFYGLCTFGLPEVQQAGTC